MVRQKPTSLKHLSYLDSMTVYGKDQEDHDAKFKRLMETAQEGNLKYSDSKTYDLLKTPFYTGLCYRKR